MKSLMCAALLLGACSARRGHRRPPLKKPALPGVPAFVVDYAPLVYLYSGDPYRPADIGSQLANTRPEVNFTVLSNAPSPLTLDNLDALNDLSPANGTNVYLTSKVDITTNPAWLNGQIPDSNGSTGSAVSCAIIVNDRGNGAVDAFYMYFYAFDWGGTFVGTNVGNHVGDWEHNMVRFANGTPTAVWYSQHSNGEAFTYDTVQKSGLRPITFSANGSHANFAMNGTHDHSADLHLSAGLLEDYTDNGPIWDPTLAAYYYSYDADSQTFAAYDSCTPVNWLNFTGKWGDQQYPDSDPRQLDYLNLHLAWRYSSGPTGPEDKQLNRTDVCPDNGSPCVVRTVLGP